MRDPSWHDDVFWQPASARNIVRRRHLVLFGICLLTIVVFSSANFIAQGVPTPGEHVQFKRQFQFGAILAAYQGARQTGVVKTAALSDTNAADARPETEPPSPPIFDEDSVSDADDTVGAVRAAQNRTEVLLGALTEAFSRLVQDSASLGMPNSTVTLAASTTGSATQLNQDTVDTSRQSSSPQPLDVAHPPSTDTSSDSAVIIGRTPSQEVQTSSHDTFGLLADLSGEEIPNGNSPTQDHHLQQESTDAFMLSGPLLSLLEPLSRLLKLTISIDMGAAGRLLDAILDALPINTDAVASAIPPVAAQASASFEDVLPLILPAVAAALGHQLEYLDNVNAAQVPELVRSVLKQGLEIINDISIIARNSLTPGLRAILDQVTTIVFAAAKRLGERLCSITQDVQGIPVELISLCSTTTGLQSQSTLSENTTPQITATPLIVTVATESTFLGDLSTSLVQTYGATNGAPSGSLPSTSSTCANTVQAPTASYSSPSHSCTSGTEPQEIPQTTSYPLIERPSCPNCPPCNECASVVTSTDIATGVQTASSTDVASGPCPGRGFPCADCLNGWFCPPQETPAQVVPCGLGWPCFHCKSGWYCAVQASPVATSQLSIPSVQTLTIPTSAASPVDSNGPADSSAHDWRYMGCFRDAIDRILTGARPLDYLRGNMSNATCIDHCASKGYLFGGTECGTECWCGSSIRDDAVRLPESSCDASCQGAEHQQCGGSWAISVFMISSKVEYPGSGGVLPGPPPVGTSITTMTVDHQGQSPVDAISTTMPVAPPTVPTQSPVLTANPDGYGPMFRLLLEGIMDH